MNNLIDTHALIWFLNGDNDLSEKARKSIEDTTAINFVSIVSLWEIAVKVSLGKLELKTPFYKISEQLKSNGFQILPITFETPYYYQTYPSIIETHLIGLSFHKVLLIN
jgi:PIN domain nuclease of toxin-antitoxin system